jgi:hypothetical protein
LVAALMLGGIFMKRWIGVNKRLQWGACKEEVDAEEIGRERSSENELNSKIFDMKTEVNSLPWNGIKLQSG